MDEPQIMSRLINWALTDLMLAHPEIVLMGEDVGRKGGVYGVTQKLHARFGSDRVIDTLLDEQSILGLAIGMAHNGFVPMPEIQFLAYLHNAEDQLRGEAATLSFFSNGQYTNPMVLRIAGLGYQKGFGGHFHNDNSRGRDPRHSRRDPCVSRRTGPMRRRCCANACGSRARSSGSSSSSNRSRSIRCATCTRRRTAAGCAAIPIRPRRSALGEVGVYR